MKPRPIAIIQARLNSTRLPRKMLEMIDGKTLVRRAWESAARAVGRDNVFFTIPAGDADLIREVESFCPPYYIDLWNGDEADVLWRFYRVANRHRWHPDTVVLRITPDDPFKLLDDLLATLEGVRTPVVTGGEACTLAMLNEWILRDLDPETEEHIGELLGGPYGHPEGPEARGWTVDTPKDLRAARLLLKKIREMKV